MDRPVPERLASLDSLRGIAAAVVVIHHALMTSAGMAQLDLSGPASALGWERLVATTPLHLLWAGPEAVLVFFALSGVVLALAMDRDGSGWRSYYPRRLVRLYVPVWASVFLALGLAIVVPRRSEVGFGWWLNGHAQAVTWRSVLSDLFLLRGTNWLNSPLWSLQWEVCFSLLLPAYLLVARRTRRWVLPVLLGLVLLIGVGSRYSHDSLKYLPVFGFGVLLGVHLEGARRRTAGWQRSRWWVLTLLSLLTLDAPWLQLFSTSRYAQLASPLGAAGVVAVVALAPGAQTLASFAVLRWLGRISFSLYLVHEPILVSVAQLPVPRPLGVLAIGAPLALAVAAAFHRWVEVPSQRLAARLAQAGSSGDAMGRRGGKLGFEPVR